MDFSASASIHFYELQDTADEISSSAASDELLFSEQLLYACLTLRQLVNMKGDRFAGKLSQFLLYTSKHPYQFLEEDPVFLIGDFAGKLARKRFIADLQLQSGIPLTPDLCTTC